MRIRFVADERSREEKLDTVAPEGGEDFVEPAQLSLLGEDATAQDQVLVHGGTLQCARIWNRPFATPRYVPRSSARSRRSATTWPRSATASLYVAPRIFTARSRVRESVSELPRPVRGSAIEWDSSARPRSVTR